MDLFGEEQQIDDNAANYIKSVKNGEPYDFGEFVKLAKEYHAILKQLRRVTKFSDRTVDDLHENNLDLTDKVHYDTLTGIYNRRYMEENFVKNIQSLSSSGDVLSVMIMDIDFFKRYNDTYGHSAGDDCLRTVAKAISACAEQNNGFVARYGGEEFVAVLPRMDDAGARLLSERMLETVRGLSIAHEKNDAADCVTVSIGVTTISPKHEHNFMDYIKKVDIALYDSKQHGRNRSTYIKYEGDTQ